MNASGFFAPKGALVRRALSAAALVSMIFLVAGCGGGGGASVTQPPPNGLTYLTGVTRGQNVVSQSTGWTPVTPAPVQPHRKWTFLVYMNGANDLETYGVLNMNQMEKIGSTDQVNMVVQFKRKGNDLTKGKWTNTRRFFVTHDTDDQTINSQLLSTNDNVDMGTVAALQDFIQWGVQTFPADRYCLVLWNHGAGWRSVPLSQHGRGFSYDDATGHHIDTIQMPAAIDMGNGRKWDLLTIDCSLMQMAEVAYEIRDKENYIVGSEESPPGAGYPYDTVMDQLTKNPDMDGRQLGINIANDTIAHYGIGSDSTQSVLDASRVGAVASAVNALGGALLQATPRYGVGIASMRRQSEAYEYPDNHDLLDFCLLLTNASSGVADSGVQSAANQVIAAVNNALVINAHGNAHAHSNGLAIFLPSPSAYNQIDQEQYKGFGQRYSELALSKAAPNWQSFLVQGPPDTTP